MDLTLVNTASAIQQSQTYNSVQIAVASQALQNQRAQGAAAVQLIQAANGIAGGDALTAAATGLGGKIDTYA